MIDIPFAVFLMALAAMMGLAIIIDSRRRRDR